MIVNKNDIMELDNFKKDTLRGIPFDKGLPLLRKKLWEIAIRNKTTGDVVFSEYMDYLSSKEEHK